MEGPKLMVIAFVAFVVIAFVAWENPASGTESILNQSPSINKAIFTNVVIRINFFLFQRGTKTHIFCHRIFLSDD